jgi:hypothetical protein
MQSAGVIALVRKKQFMYTAGPTRLLHAGMDE